jgi:hypothetical protein
MKTKLFLITLTAFINAYLLNEIDNVTSPSSELLIYGTITTEDNESYTGQIRWGKEEAFWFDYFNSSKPENEFLDYLTDDELDDLSGDSYYTSNNSWLGKKTSIVSWSGNSDHTHSFACQFGDIKSIEMGRGERVNVILKNGYEMKLEGGSNDIGAQIQIHDKEIGLIKVKWKNIEKVEFTDTPTNLVNALGEPLYGTVKSEEGDFTGYLQWDHDERLTEDELNGETEDGDLDIKFGNIKSIKKEWKSCTVTLNSGRSFELEGTNDVNKSNRGIIVNMPGQGRVDIQWDEFEEIYFTTPPSNTRITYNSYTGEQDLYGTVNTNSGQKHTGYLVYDLDEQFELEILNGMIDDIEYFIPFSNISVIEPHRRDRAMVTLKNGKRLELEDKVDVNKDNDGILIFEKGKDGDAVYVSWDNVDSVKLN